MPATYTHHLFTKDVYKALDTNIQNKLDINLFDLFGKSFDAFFFYKPKIGSYAHKNHANLYFANIISYMKNNSLTKDTDLLSYLYGSLCHYVLDSTIHPFIYYYGGKYERKNKKTYVYRGRHDYLELMIDAIWCQERNHKKVQQCSLGREIFPNMRFSDHLIHALDSVYFDTFQIKNGGKLYFKAYKKYRFLFKYFMMSRFGIKKKLYSFVDLFHVVPSVMLQNHCYYVSRIDTSVLNLEHKKWYYPVDRKISFHYSFYDLYDIAIIKAIRLIQNGGCCFRSR